MESEEWNSKRFTKYYFQVFLEDEEETSLFMDSWIYLDHEVDEELSYAQEPSSPDQDVIDNTKKLGDKFESSQAESFSCNSSAEDNHHNLSVTVPHFQISDEPKNMSMHKTSIEHTPKDDRVLETTCTDASEVWSSELPAEALHIRTNVSKHATVAYTAEDENSVGSSDSGVVESADTISEMLSFMVDDTIGVNETQLPDVRNSDENTAVSPDSSIAKSPDTFIAESDDTVSKSLLPKVLDANIDSDETNIYPDSKLCILEDKNTAEILASGADKSSDIISKSFISAAANDTNDYNEISTHPSHIHCSNASRSFLHGTVNSSETYKYSTDLCRVKVENFEETSPTHVPKFCSSETVKFAKYPVIKTESNWPSKREKQPVSSKNQNKTSSESVEVITISDDDAPIVISDDEDSDSDIDMVYVGPHTAIVVKDENPSLGKKIKHKHKERYFTTHKL